LRHSRYRWKTHQPKAVYERDGGQKEGDAFSGMEYPLQANKKEEEIVV